MLNKNRQKLHLEQLYKCYWIKKQLEPFVIHPMINNNIVCMIYYNKPASKGRIL